MTVLSLYCKENTEAFCFLRVFSHLSFTPLPVSQYYNRLQRW